MSMRKRRASLNDPQEAETTLLMLVKAAIESQKQIPESGSGEATPPELPQALEQISNSNQVKNLSDEQLVENLELIKSWQTQTVDKLAKWEEFGKNLKNALDATLMMISVKTEPSIAKRRRTIQVDYGDLDLETDPVLESEVKSELSASPQAASKPTSPGPPAPVIKTENSAESVPSPGGKSVPSRIDVGRQVAFKLPGSLVDEWIQCEVTKIVTVGYRLEVRDPEPDDHGNPGKTYQCRLKDVILLPLPHEPVKVIPVGTVVLAQYPETTAFYKAKVASYNSKERVYNLKFEGEEDTLKETIVKDSLVVLNKR